MYSDQLSLYIYLIVYKVIPNSLVVLVNIYVWQGYLHILVGLALEIATLSPQLYGRPHSSPKDILQKINYLKNFYKDINLKINRIWKTCRHISVPSLSHTGQAIMPLLVPVHIHIFPYQISHFSNLYFYLARLNLKFTDLFQPYLHSNTLHSITIPC